VLSMEIMLRAEWAGVRIPVGERDCFLLQNVQTVSGSHPPCYSMGAGSAFPTVKRSGRETDHTLPPSGEVKNE
jgi:hypothetical protein